MKEYKILKVARIVFNILAWVGLAFFVVIGVGVLFAPGTINTPQGDVQMTIGMKIVACITYLITGAINFFILKTLVAIISMLFDLKASSTKLAA